jgi:hypothetical protein
MRIFGRIGASWYRFQERVQLGRLYAPDPGSVDLDVHLAEAVAWLKRAQDAGSDRGVSYGVRFGGTFEASYPETTGYICETFVELAALRRDTDLLQRAREMGDWEMEIQMPEGAVMGGRYNTTPTPALFNTGMVLLGWAALIGATSDDRYRSAAVRAGEWMVRMQDVSGSWRRGNSKYAHPTATLYNVNAARGLCAAGRSVGETGFVDAAIRNAEYCLSRQLRNGWFPDCDLTDPEAPLVHTLAYAAQGLRGIGMMTSRQDIVDGAVRCADALLQVMRPDGFIAGRWHRDFSPAVDWCCLTGSAQCSVVWATLYQTTGDVRYRTAVQRVNHYLMARHDIRNPDSDLRGGVPGSWPVWGAYGRLRILNWATKYLVDALSREKQFPR